MSIEIQVRCQWCGRALAAKRRGAKYCCLSHRVMACNARRRAFVSTIRDGLGATIATAVKQQEAERKLQRQAEEAQDHARPIIRIYGGAPSGPPSRLTRQLDQTLPRNAPTETERRAEARIQNARRAARAFLTQELGRAPRRREDLGRVREVIPTKPTARVDFRALRTVLAQVHEYLWPERVDPLDAH